MTEAEYERRIMTVKWLENFLSMCKARHYQDQAVQDFVARVRA